MATNSGTDQPVGTKEHRLQYTKKHHGKKSREKIAENLNVEVGTVEDYERELGLTGGTAGSGESKSDAASPDYLNLDFGSEPIGGRADAMRSLRSTGGTAPMAVPSAVADAARVEMAKVPNRIAPSSAISRGDLRLIKPTDGTTREARLGLVLNADPRLEFTEVALVHPYPELATSMDGVVPGEFAGTPFEVVVQTDLRGIVWTSAQVTRLVGQLSADTLETISNLIQTGTPESTSGIRIGTPLRGPHDRRWSFKATEGQALSALASDCTGEVLRADDEGRQLTVPPGRNGS